jgi:hypothetical protein
MGNNFSLQRQVAQEMANSNSESFLVHEQSVSVIFSNIVASVSVIETFLPQLADNPGAR